MSPGRAFFTLISPLCRRTALCAIVRSNPKPPLEQLCDYSSFTPRRLNAAVLNNFAYQIVQRKPRGRAAGRVAFIARDLDQRTHQLAQAGNLLVDSGYRCLAVGSGTGQFDSEAQPRQWSP